MSGEVRPLALGFDKAAETVGLSRRFLEYAAADPDPSKRLKTVRVATRRLIRLQDLQDWFDRLAKEETERQVEVAS